ncbi:MAG: ABC transporter ATP-binding protein [Actinomycetota bacterium]
MSITLPGRETLRTFDPGADRLNATMQTAFATEGLVKFYGDTPAVAGVHVDVARAEILALLGPSGCGKTTFLRLIAGFERPDAGVVRFGDQQMAGPHRFVPPERRSVGFVFQDYALFPHMRVADNVGYGVRGDRARRRSRVTQALDLVGLGDLGDRYPHELSGGQQQRVALARALAPEPQIVLLDEPFSNLDADLRTRVRTEVRDILRAAGATAIFVTHDQEEALEIADRVAVMHDGRIEQIGRPEEIYHTPATRFVADFVGEAEFLPAVVKNNLLSTDLGSFALPNSGVTPGPGELMLRPEDIHLSLDPSSEAEVVAERFHGPFNRTVVRLPSGRMLVSAHSSQATFHPGDRVRVEFRPDHLVLFRGETRAAWIPAGPRAGT